MCVNFETNLTQFLALYLSLASFSGAANVMSPSFKNKQTNKQSIPVWICTSVTIATVEAAKLQYVQVSPTHI